MNKTPRIALIVCIFLALAIGAYALYFTQVANPKVITELRAEPNGERAQRVLLLTFPSGKTLPLNYWHDGGMVYLGADFSWWKAFSDGDIPVRLFIRGREYNGRARVIRNDPAFKAKIFAVLRPTVPKWLPHWLDAELVQIKLDDEST